MPILIIFIIIAAICLSIFAEKMKEKKEEKKKEEEKAKLNEKYIDFPKIEKEESALIKIEEKRTEKYDRITMDYSNVSIYEFELYERKIEDYGFNKETNVRYDKNNTYVILEYNEKRQTLHVVFHIKTF